MNQKQTGPNIEKIHYINVGKGGTFCPSGDPYDSVPQDIDSLFQYLEESNKKKLVIYFHGGLVPADSGISTAERIVRYATNYTDAHPICFIWETGIKETIQQNMETIAQSDFFRRLLIKIIKVAGKSLGIDVVNSLISSTPKGTGNLTEEEILLELNEEEPFKNYVINSGARSASVLDAINLQNKEDIDRYLIPEITEEITEEILADWKLKKLAEEEKPRHEAALMDSERLIDIKDDSKGIISAAKLIAAAVKITVQVIKRHIQGRNHDFYPTIVEEALREIYVADLGEWAWGRMKNKAKLMWQQDDFHDDPSKWPAGYYFLKKLDEYQSKVGKLTIDLVGHSAGSIAICELIKSLKVNAIDLHFRHIIFMAPACRCDLFAETVLTEPQKFSSFRCFTMNDEQEKKDSVIKYLYPRSLLYLISGILEEEPDAHILGLQRHITGKHPYTGGVFNNIIDFLKPQGRIIYSVTDGAEIGFQSRSISHGGFDDDYEITLDSIMHLINQQNGQEHS